MPVSAKKCLGLLVQLRYDHIGLLLRANMVVKFALDELEPAVSLFLSKAVTRIDVP